MDENKNPALNPTTTPAVGDPSGAEPSAPSPAPTPPPQIPDIPAPVPNTPQSFVLNTSDLPSTGTPPEPAFGPEPATTTPISSPPFAPQSKKPKGKLIAAVAAIVLLVIGAGAGIFALNRNTELREKAANGVSDFNHCAAFDGQRRTADDKVTNIACEGWVQDNKSCESDQVNPYYFNTCRNTGANTSDAAHCARFDGKRQIQGKETNIVCEGWDQNNKSCAADQENPYYFASCKTVSTPTPTPTASPASGGGQGASSSDHCAGTDGKRKVGGVVTNITCENKVASNTSCQSDSENPVYYSLCKNTGENPSDFNHCARFDGKRQIQGVVTNIVCEGWVQDNKSCVADQENPYYFNLCKNTGQNPSDAAHCADFAGKRMIQGKASGITCTGWQQTNKSCIADQENPYYFQTCSGTAAGGAPGDSRCTELQILKGGTVVAASQIEPGDTITLRAYCYSAENETFDKFHFIVSKYQGATTTNDTTATRATDKDQGNKKFYSASHPFTTEAAQYTAQVWGHTVSKGWKGK